MAFVRGVDIPGIPIGNIAPILICPKSSLIITRFVRFAGVWRKTGGQNAAAGAFLTEQTKARAARGRRSSFAKDKSSFRASMHEGAVVVEGYAKKRSTGFRKTWQARFFVVEGHYLKYFGDERKAEMKGAVDLNDLQSCLRADETLSAGAAGTAQRELHLAFASLSGDAADGLSVVLRLPYADSVGEWAGASGLARCGAVDGGAWGARAGRAAPGIAHAPACSCQQPRLRS